MAATESFDITSGVDLQEVDNAINQATKEISQRYDFKGQKAEIEYDRKNAKLELSAADEFYLTAMWNVITIIPTNSFQGFMRNRVPSNGGQARRASQSWADASGRFPSCRPSPRRSGHTRRARTKSP